MELALEIMLRMRNDGAYRRFRLSRVTLTKSQEDPHHTHNLGQHSRTTNKLADIRENCFRLP